MVLSSLRNSNREFDHKTGVLDQIIRKWLSKLKVGTLGNGEIAESNAREFTKYISFK